MAVADVAPKDPNADRFFGLSTRTPETVTLEPTDGAKMANYLLRWVNAKGEVGP